MARDNQDLYLSSSDNDALLKQKILGTHAQEVVEEVDVKPLLSIVDDIMSQAKPLSADTGSHEIPSPPDDYKVLDMTSQHRTAADRVAQIAKVLEYPINHTSYVMTYKCGVGVESHSVTMELFESVVSNYSWDAKVVITYAAFAINYGDFCLVQQLIDDDHDQYPKIKNQQLAGSIATLMGFPDVMAPIGDQLKMESKPVLDLLTKSLKLTHCIIEFKEIPHIYISRQIPEIPVAVYWIIRSLLVSTSILTNIFGDYDEYITKTSAKAKRMLSILDNKLSPILQNWQNQLKSYKDLVESDKKYIEFQETINSTQVDNMTILSAIICSGEDQRPLYDGSRRTKEPLEVLKQKHLLLLISDLDPPLEELHILHLIHSEHSVLRHDYEILWLPIVDPTISMTSLRKTIFYDLRNNMPWYSVDHPSFVDPVAIRYAREDLHFVHMPMIVVLDPKGKLTHHDALPMMWIWGATSFPFSKDTERALWDEFDWNIDLLADGIDLRIQEWIRDNKIICLYGGDSVYWILKFTKSARAVARALNNVPLEMLYVGKREPKDKVRRCHEVISRGNLSHVFSVTEYYDYVWYFWKRLYSMWNSKNQSGGTVDNDHIMREIMGVLAYDSGQEGWALFSRGNYEITMANFDRLLPILDSYTKWAHEVDHPDKFVTALDKNLRGYLPDHHCQRLILPGQAAYIPDKVVCSVCGKTMDKYVMYRCCTD